MKKYINVFIRWVKMLLGKSVFHRTQKYGLFWKKDSVAGYYSDLRHKVTDNNMTDLNGVPVNITSEGKEIYFPTTVFQYGLGAYDLYLQTKEEHYMDKFFVAVKWCIDNQMENGGWNVFEWCTKDVIFSSMVQGEGASLLCRAFVQTKDPMYLEYAKQAIDLMLTPVEKNGTACYKEGKIESLEEVPDYKTIMNGMIFSIWGLYDYCLCTNDEYCKEKMMQAVSALEKLLPKYDRRYWSNYDLDGHIASPFYHSLHIEQLHVMADMFDNKKFREYEKKFKKYQNSGIKRKIAFFAKAVQKLRKIRTDIVIVK